MRTLKRLISSTVAFILCIIAVIVSACTESDYFCVTSTTEKACSSPCKKLVYSCPAGTADVLVLQAGDPLPDGLDSLAAVGDIVLKNDQVLAVIDAISHPHFLSPSGGTLLDLAPRPGGHDSLNQAFHAVGLLPRDTAYYDEQTLLQHPGFAAVEFRGHLYDQPARRVVTRYEIRPCDPGIRVRTEVHNGQDEATAWMLSDGFFWGGRANLPFTPVPDGGFLYPPLDLENAAAALQDMPFLAATSHSTPASAYVSISCNDDSLGAFSSEKISAAGTKLRVVQARDYAIFERFIGVAGGRSVSPAVDLALEARRQLFDEPWTELRGSLKLVTDDGRMGDENRGSVTFSVLAEEEPSSRLTPVTQITPAADGHFTVRLPSQRTYFAEVKAFGQVVATRRVRVELTPVEMEPIELPAAAQLSISVKIDGVPDRALVFLHPADEPTRRAVTGRLFGQFTECAPLLGPPHGESPACNRLLVNKTTVVSLPPGSYLVYALAGPFRTIGQKLIQLTADTVGQVSFGLTTLPLKPAGSLAADLHIHGSASFDASIPAAEQVTAAVTLGLDVVAITDHSVVQDYSGPVAELGLAGRVRFLSGVETTGLVLFDYVPGSSFPKVIGHWSFWSLPFDRTGPYRGAPWDQRVEPGQLFAKIQQAGWRDDQGIIQLNHPWSKLEVGRDLAFPSAIGINATKALPLEFDGSAQSLFHRRPDGTPFRNSDYHAQEVMSGTDNEHYAAYRAFWFYLLNQGVIRAGTANSDSHGLTRNLIGSPRNLVFTDTTLPKFDEGIFNAAVRAGRIVGTNGPIIQASLTDRSGNLVTPSTAAFVPALDARLRLRITAAPWVPVDEVRVVVNGVTVRTLRRELQSPADPFGKVGLGRFEGDLLLRDLLSEQRTDSWLVVEAGQPLEPSADLNCDGIPDTGDNNSDGVIDWRDVDRNDDGEVDDRDAIARPAPCQGGSGPLKDPPPPTSTADPHYHFRAVNHIGAAHLFKTSNGYPLAFTNPFLLDLDGVPGFQRAAR